MCRATSTVPWGRQCAFVYGTQATIRCGGTVRHLPWQFLSPLGHLLSTLSGKRRGCMTSIEKATERTRVPIALDGGLLRRIVDMRFPEGVPAFLDYWHNALDAQGRPYVKAPTNRATLYRWFQGDLPGSADTLIELCAVLEVDPFSLFTLAGDDASQATAKILTAMESGLWQHKSMAVLSNFLGRRADWPPKVIGSRYENGWYTYDFFHDPTVKAGVMGNFQIRLLDDPHPEVPKVLHFAYRHLPHFGGRWLQYGIVRFVEGSSILININGSIEAGFAPAADGPFTVETVFGLGPADFRLASLTPFEAVAGYEVSSDSGRVGFR